MTLLTDLVETIAGEGVSVSKKICYQSLQAHVQTTLNLFPVFIHQADVTDMILKFFLALFQGQSPFSSPSEGINFICFSKIVAYPMC